MAIAADVGSAPDIRRAYDEAMQAFGKIDIIVNNAAFQMERDSLDEISEEEWDYTFAVNITAMFHIVKAAVPHMQPGASIINTGSFTPARRSA